MALNAIDHLRALLDHLDGESRADQLAFFRAILAAGPDAIQELDGRLPGVRAPRGLRQLALEASFYFPWPEWVPILSRILRYETDVEIFVTGTRALGRAGGKQALEALRELLAMRQGAEFQEVIAGVLSETDPAEAFNHFLSRLLEGSTNPAVANEAALRLIQLVHGGCLGQLRALVLHPDLLVSRQALMLITKLYTVEAAQALLEIFRDNHGEVLADRALKEALGTLRSCPPAVAREAAQEGLARLAEEHGPQGLLQALYTQVLSATDAGKSGQLLLVLTQAAEGLHVRSRRLGFAVDTAAEGLAVMAAKGLVPPERVLALLVEGYRAQSGREGLARALARVVPAEASEVHQLILGGPDGAQRAAAVEILGERQEEALQPVLLQACRDAITDISDRALFHLGRLASAEALARELLRATAPEELRLGLRLVAGQRFQTVVADLVEMMKTATREDLVLLAIETLGAVGAAQSAEPLLEMLHSGQSPRLQLALALALRDLRQPEVALALCAKADELRQSSLQAIAVEALALAHGVPEAALPAMAGPVLLQQVRKVWNERNPWALRLRLVVALQQLCLDHPDTWRALAQMVHESLTEKRPQSAWTAAELHQVQAAARDFSRRA